VRSVVYRHDDLRQLADSLEGAFGQTLLAPPGSNVRDGEWVLAMFEIGRSGRATAAAGRGVLLDAGAALVFERRDWERLRQFASAPTAESSTRLPVAAAVAELPPIDVEIDPSETGETAVPIVPQGPPPELAHAQPLKGRTAAYEAYREPPAPVVRPSPVAPPAPTPTAPPAEARADAPRLPRVLLVDDDPYLQDVVVAMLEAVGLAVVAVETAEEGLERLRAERPELLVLDWSLPGMSGLELCKLLRREAVFATLPILFLTAHAGTQDMVEAFAAGADDYVVKPFRAAELGARIFGLLRRARVASARERP
jgi:two-component system phosphate regulon response regulator PhoB